MVFVEETRAKFDFFNESSITCEKGEVRTVTSPYNFNRKVEDKDVVGNYDTHTLLSGFSPKIAFPISPKRSCVRF